MLAHPWSGEERLQRFWGRDKHLRRMESLASSGGRLGVTMANFDVNS
jgi:hypothetical protein